MQRLNTATLSDFLSEPGVAAVMFGAPRGEASMGQAVQFAEANDRLEKIDSRSAG